MGEGREGGYHPLTATYPLLARACTHTHVCECVYAGDTYTCTQSCGRSLLRTRGGGIIRSATINSNDDAVERSVMTLLSDELSCDVRHVTCTSSLPPVLPYSLPTLFFDSTPPPSSFTAPMSIIPSYVCDFHLRVFLSPRPFFLIFAFNSLHPHLSLFFFLLSASLLFVLTSLTLSCSTSRLFPLCSPLQSSSRFSPRDVRSYSVATTTTRHDSSTIRTAASRLLAFFVDIQ